MNTATLKAGAAYFALVFMLAFMLGAFRVTVLVPRVGEWLAVMLELPVMLTAAWYVCRWVVRRFGVPVAAGPRLAMGAVAFALLMAEFTLSSSAFGSTSVAFFTGLATPSGLLGLAGQVLFGLWPWWQGRAGLGAGRWLGSR